MKILKVFGFILMQNKCKYKDEEISPKTEALFFNQLLVISCRAGSWRRLKVVFPLQAGMPVLSLLMSRRAYTSVPGQLDGPKEKF